MAKFKLTNKAVDDLTQIWNYSNLKWSENQADKYYQMLIDNFNEVANNPDMGKSYSGVIENLSGFKVGRHIIFYRKIEDDVIEIVRILHEQMDLKNRIKDK
ncbi:MAG: type II toxin-antitoxin system RelE/ParE family toxin [Bacteroidetes bacterium]|nr:type II toxin-antitoxin system RelE/ParE family toxin [Bacteroidales bacterium]NJO70319.1 type II toxin-antitoxin system RelE/ParE family toxin [Bacteroidota bacterium]